MITCKKYLETLYNILLGDDGEGYIGTKSTLKYTISLKTKCFIDKNYLNKTLLTFRDLNLLGETIVNCATKGINIGNCQFAGSKSFYPGVRVSNEELLEKMSIAESVLAKTFKAKVKPVIKKQDLKELQELIKIKKELTIGELGYIPSELFSNFFNKEYGAWIYDINPDCFEDEREKFLSYTKEFFEEYKFNQETKMRKKREEEDINQKVNSLYSELITEIQNKIMEYVKVNDYLSILINKPLSLSPYKPIYPGMESVKRTNENVGCLEINGFDIENKEGQSSKLVFSNELGCIKVELSNIFIIEDEDNFYKISIEGYVNEIETEPFLEEYEALKLKGILSFIENLEKDDRFKRW